MTVRVTDNGVPSLSDTKSFTVTVNEVNTAPVLAAIGNQTINEGATLTLPASATDADSLPILTYSLVSPPTGASINLPAGRSSDTPLRPKGRALTRLQRKPDNGSPTLSDTKSLTVTVNEMNTAPVLAAIGNQTINEGDADAHRHGHGCR